MFLDLSPLRRHRDFRLVFVGQLVSTFGTFITYVALPVQVFALTKSSAAVGLIGSVQLVPLALTALWGGALADSLDRRKLLLRCEAFAVKLYGTPREWRTVAQLQEENAALKEDLGFLRNIMSSGAAPEGIGVSNLKVERDGKPNEYRYRMLLTQGGQRKQDFKGRVQIVARVARDGAMSTLTFPDAAVPDAAGAFEFRFYHKVEGRFAIPEGTTLKGVDVRVLALPGGQVKLSRTINQL